MNELRCPGCDRLVRFESSGTVRVVCDRLADGRYIVRAEGSSDEFGIVDGDLDFAWTPEMKPRRLWILHECSFGGGAYDRVEITSTPPSLTDHADLDVDDA
jgi:hypothetical protein